jgi:hypothetical protein
MIGNKQNQQSVKCLSSSQHIAPISNMRDTRYNIKNAGPLLRDKAAKLVGNGESN